MPSYVFPQAMASFTRFRPTSHFIAPHSWSNDPCGAVYVPETKEYLLCYQWNPGTHEGGNCAWGMARSNDLVTWTDCTPPLMNGPEGSYDHLGVFSGSIVSRLVEGKRVLFLFYTSVAALPIHWSKEYLEGCESQSVAFSTDFGASWHRYENNPLLSTPPKKALSTGWRDPFVSPWETLSEVLGNNPSTSYMMIASGEKGYGSALHLYSSNNLLHWDICSTILEVQANTPVSPTSKLQWGMNFECASFFNIGKSSYIVIGVEEDLPSKRHNRNCTLWLQGDFILENGKPKFKIASHGQIDCGILYAIHLFRDAENRLLQLGWADEAAKEPVVKAQGWAGCLAHPRELYEISKPIAESARNDGRWTINEKTGNMTTLGIRVASQVSRLRKSSKPISLRKLSTLCSTNYEIEAKFSAPSGSEKFIFNVRESADSKEVTKIEFDLKHSLITINRSQASLENLGSNFSEIGDLSLLQGEDLEVRIFVDNSILEVYANDRFAVTSRIYPSGEARGASVDFGGWEEGRMGFECWEGLRDAWPKRRGSAIGVEGILEEKRIVEVLERPVVCTL